MLDPSGKLLATAADNDLLKLWDLPAKQEVARLKGHHLAFSPAGGLLVAALNEDPIALYDTNTHENVGELVGHGTWVFALAFSDDGTTLVSGDRTACCACGMSSVVHNGVRSKTTHKLTASRSPRVGR